jgi:hypothetical protein
MVHKGLYSLDIGYFCLAYHDQKNYSVIRIKSTKKRHAAALTHEQR